MNWLSYLGQKIDIRISGAGKMPFSLCFELGKKRLPKAGWSPFLVVRTSWAWFR